MLPKIVFILNRIPNQRCIKRIDEFIEHGYEVDAYTFVRQGVDYNLPKNFELKIIGEIKEKGNFHKRLKMMIGAITKVGEKYKKEPVIFYYFGLDIALFSRLTIKKPYFYEESDIAQTYVGNQIIRKVLDVLDRRIIRKSFQTVFTSEGFIDYHFEENKPEHTHVIPNRLNKSILSLSEVSKKPLDINHLSIGFVGFIRYESLVTFADVFSREFPQHTFHFYGVAYSHAEEVEKLKLRDNVHAHGKFSSPDDLPKIYSAIDLVLSTYDLDLENVRYAEPNKLYEAIFFKTPIIVTSDTFLARKVEKLGIGYSLDATKPEQIVDFVKSLTEKDLQDKISRCSEIPREYTINDNQEFFEKLAVKFGQS